MHALNEWSKDLNQVNNQIRRVNLMLLLMAGVYAIQLADAFFIERNENLSWNFKEPSFQLSFSNLGRDGNSFQMQWNFKF
ncbi:MAG: hypothetical protein N3A69_15200 [Leptospiraceae bacterium]|nr:hypothetical protein [Leptospiraceae bacterium]